MALEEQLALDISDALRQVDTLESALTSAAQSFQVALAEAIDVLSAVTVTADAAPVTQALDEAVESADLTAEVVGDASDVTTAVDDAIAAADNEVVVQPITDSITDEITAAIDAADAVVTIEADTTQAEADISNLGAEVGGLRQNLIDSDGDLQGFAGNAALLGQAIRGAAGDTASASAGIAGLGSGAGTAVGIIGALGFAVKTFTDQAIDADAAARRFERVFGELGSAVDTIDIPGLSTDLSTLAVTLGADDDTLRDVAASFAEVGIASGQTQAQVAESSQQLLLLAARAAVLNPQLGTADQIATRLGGALARGGRFASQFGIALTSAEITARALQDTGKKTAAELTQYEKAAAGAAIATERLGNRIGKDITDGADQPIIKLRSLKQELLETFEDAGAQLVDPLVGSLEAATPILVTLARLLGPVLQAALFGTSVILDAIGDSLGVIADGVEVLFRLLGNAPLVGDKFDEWADSAGELSDQLHNVTGEADDAADATGDAGDEAAGAAPSFESLAEEAAAAAEALQAIVDAQIAGLGSTLALTSAEDRFRDSVDDVGEKQRELNEAVKEFGRGSPEAIAAQDAYNESLKRTKQDAFNAAQQAVQTAIDIAKATGDQIPSAEEQMNIFRSALRNMAVQASGPTREAILTLLGELSKFEGERQATLRVNAEQATAAIAKARSELEKLLIGIAGLNGGNRRQSVGDFLSDIANGNMAGGPVEGPGLIEVGERGRELLWLGENVSGQVLSGSRTAAFEAQSASANAALVAAINNLARQRATTSGGRPLVEQLHVHEVTSDPATTTFAIASLLGDMADR